jgi:hypothetical protein
MASEIKVDTISEKTSANGVSIDGLKIKDVTSGSVMSKPVLQIVTGTTTTDTGSITSTSFTDTGLTASITPSATSSKILVMVQQNQSVYRDSNLEVFGYINIMRDSTEIGEWYAQGRSAPLLIGPVHISYLDSPSSTSALTYKTQIKVSTTDNGGVVRANQFSASGESPSSIHLIEIAG